MKNQKFYLFGLILFLSIFFVFHYSIIVLKVGPVNPISLKIKPLTEQYTKLFFGQNWHLFAPDPVSFNALIYMQVNNVNLGEDQWIDISTPLIEKNHEKIFTPYNRIVRLIDGLSSDLIGNSQDDVLTMYLKKASNEAEQHEENIKLAEEYIDTQLENGEINIYRYASSYAKALYPNTPTNVRVKVVIHDSIPFSERKNEDFSPTLLYEKTFDWKPLIEDVIEFY